MNPILEVWLIVLREVRKTVASVKGIVMFVVSLLGALACTTHVPRVDDALAKAKALGIEDMRDVKAKAFAELYMSDSAGDRLADAPIKLVFLFWVAVWLTPLFVAIIGFDGIPSDLQYRSIRYWTIRSRRASYYVGKFLGLWLMISIMTFVMHALFWAVTIGRAEATAAETLSWGGLFYLISLPISAAWCGLATLIGSLFRTPILALLITCASFFTLFIAGFVVGRSTDNTILRGVYPNSYDSWMLSTNLNHALGGLGVVLAYALVTIVAGAFIFSMRDV